MTMFEDFSASVFAPVLPPNSTSKISLIYILFVVLILVELLTISVWGGVMVGVLATSALDHGFQPRLGEIKDYEIGICCFSAKHATLSIKSRLVSSESRLCVGEGRHVYPQTVVSVG